MSALFVAVTIVVALGASAIVTTAGRDGTGIEGLGSTVASLLNGIGLRTAATAGPSAQEALAAEREAGSASVNMGFLATLVRDNAEATSKEFAHVYAEMTSLKNEMSALRTAQNEGNADVRTIAARLDGVTAAVAATRDQVATVRADIGLLQGSLGDMSAALDIETDRINKQLAKIEDVISIRADITAAIPRQTFPPLPRKRAARPGGWTAEELGNGKFLVKGPTGAFEVTVGSHVPGLGRIEAIRQQGGRLSLVTGKDDGTPTD